MNEAIFLSASVPDPERDPKYARTADVTAIRDAVRALVTVVLPQARLVWGGHPAITPLIRTIATDMDITGAQHICLFQSNYFRERMPPENVAFERVVKIRSVKGDREKSLELMRKRMIGSEVFFAGIFIGGMDGVEAEYRLFRKMNPSAKTLPIASTGGAALIIFRRERLRLPPDFRDDLQRDLAYPTLFRRLLPINGGASE